MSLVVYTAIFGRTDPLHEPECETRARLIAFTDQPIQSGRWEIIQVPPVERPCRLARLAKAMSHELIPAEWSLWMDAAFTLLVDPLDLLDGAGDFTTFRHADRSRISDEAEAILRHRKAPEDLVMTQLQAYRADGFDTEDNPQRELSCNGVILRRHTPAVAALNAFWADQINTFSLRDQMSLDYSAWRCELPLSRWPGTHRDNPYFRFKHYRRPVNDV
jgi:hypothetical protein